MNINNTAIEKIDILGKMEILNTRMRESVIKNIVDEEKVKAYDIGVKNTMECLKSLITHKDGKKNRLIYQKYEEQSDDFVQYVQLSDALNELFGE